MKSLVLKSLVCGAFALTTVGCGGIDGTWEADGVGCGDFELTIDGEEATLEIPIPGGAGCTTCKYEGEITDEGSDAYSFELDGKSDCTPSDLEGDCKLNDNGDQLECDVDDVANDVEFDLKE